MRSTSIANSTRRPRKSSVGAGSVAQNLAGALGWIVQGRHSGTLKLRSDGGAGDSPTELTFLDGDLYLEGPGGDPERTVDDPRTVADLLARDLADHRPGNFRFRKIDPEDTAWKGPVATPLVMMALGVLDKSPSELLEDLGGAGAPWVADDGDRRPAFELDGNEELVLSRLGRATTFEHLNHDLGGDDDTWLVALARLRAAGLLRPANDEERDHLERQARWAREDSRAEPDEVHELEPAGGLDELVAPDLHPAALAIWRDQFQLESDPFTLTPDPAFLYLSEGHAEALAGLKLGIWERRGLMVMIGEVGTGKTTLVYSLLSNLDPEIETAYLSNTLLSFEEILASALRDFGIECESRQRIDLIEALNSFLRRCAVEGKTVALVIDEAQNLSDEVFEGLRLLLNFETYKSKLLQIVLVGQPELATRLSGPGLRQVRDRVAVRCHLNPLNRREALGYIEHRLDMVGGTADLFTRPALGLLVRKSKGIPRRINILCHNALLFAFGRDQVRVNRALASQAIRDLEGGGLRRG